MPKTEGPMAKDAMTKFVSPEYKAKCVDWALRTLTWEKKLNAARVIKEAKVIYGYVYGADPDGT